MFYVHHEYEGQRVGKAIMNYILDITSKNSINKLRVDGSITAKAFFESFDFDKVSKNEVKKDTQILINYSLELNLQNLSIK